MLTLRGLLGDLTCVLKAGPGKLDIKRRYSFYQLTIWFTPQTSKKVQRHHDLIKAHAVR